MKQIVLYISFFIPFLSAFAQESISPALVLDAVYLRLDTKPENFYAYAQKKLTRDSLQINKMSDLLQNNTAVFVREYGKGMLSSISLRGTGSNHTQIIWNGIPVNSILNGQTDLNTLYTGGFEQIYLKKGGSSVDFGSGAIGGVLIVENRLRFEKTTRLVNQTQIGSFKTVQNYTEAVVSSNKYYGKIAVQTSQSENNYPFVGYPMTNENGAYTGMDYQLIGGYKINTKQQIYFKSQHNRLNRELSRSLFKPDHAKLLTGNDRNVLGWQYQSRRINIQSDAAYLFESYDYYPNKNSTISSRSISNMYFLKNIFSIQLSPKSHFTAGNSYNYQQGISSHFLTKTRQTFAAYIVWGQKTQNFAYDLKIRKEFTAEYNVPWVGALETKYQLHKNWQVRANASKNFKIPTFNDLYWQPYGNPDLKPEESYSYEAGLDYQSNRSRLSVTGFYIQSTNLIKWTPDSNQWWSPKNIASVHYRGIEVNLQHKWTFSGANHISIEADYTYQEAVDQSTGKLVPYTPQHIALFKTGLQWDKWQVQYTNRLNGKIYTTTTNTLYMPVYDIHNLSLRYRFNQNIKMGVEVANLLNTYYENFPSRPQPGRNYNLYINFKIQ